jgi:hypothetical protein
MIDSATGESEASCDVFGFQIRELLEDLGRSEPRREQIEGVRHTDSHPANAGASTALRWVDGDPVGDGCHGFTVT